MPHIVIASSNPHKIAKIREILAPYFDDIRSLADLPDHVPMEEKGATFAENAHIKALGLSRQLHTTVIATDGGAQIPALAGRWNALHTHRFIGENKTDEDRVLKMLKMMEGITDRQMWFTEAYSLCQDGKVILEIEVNSPVGQMKDVWDGRMKPGAWLLSLWHLPNRNKDFFDLTDEETKEEEPTWAELKRKINEYFKNTRPRL